ncbi:hypothetical protein NE237_009608 [Protea cynaroides]|uniref:Uncharacterized protein n=1 Tax=Protea cynaroides TaxID=273540 RepID=A0A9Q0KXZ3_9MAGN|nr:hypothetical protein NE237_009608 [Protea cynaroides]
MGQIWGTVVDRTSLFRSQLENRRLNEGTLQIMESVLISKDVKSLLEIRSCLSEFLRSELVSILQEVEEKTVEQKLSVLEFFVRAFFLAGDVESCLMLRYEALILRERYSATHHWLHVSYEEWLAFIEHSLDNGFYSVAVKACEHASLCLQPEDIVDPKSHIFFADLQAINQLKKLKDVALALVPSNSNSSVQAQTSEYLKKKRFQKSKKQRGSCATDTLCIASSMFRNGVRKRNMWKLHEHQSMPQVRLNHSKDHSRS